MSCEGTSSEGTSATPLPPAEVGTGTWLLDAHLAGEPGVVGVFAQALPYGGFALIEAAAGSTTGAVLGGLQSIGVAPDQVRGIIVTHVHLDHAAGAATLSEATGAQVYVHEAGLRHLHDPSRLWNSAARLYGDAMDALWGPMPSIPQERLVPLMDGDEFRLGGARYRALATPGHARHHLALLDPWGGAFVGDAAGILLPNVPLIRPALPPPETDLEAADASLARLAEEAPERLYLTHFGVVDGVHDHLRRAAERIRAWGEAVRQGLAAGEDSEALIRRMETLELAELDSVGVHDPAARRRWRGSSDARMTVMGLERYWRKRFAAEDDA